MDRQIDNILLDLRRVVREGKMPGECPRCKQTLNELTTGVFETSLPTLAAAHAALEKDSQGFHLCEREPFN